MSVASDAGAADRKVVVWDAPTRIFHWSLVVLVTVAWLTGEEDGAAVVHRMAGEAVAGLLVFRILWGFIGGERARFADFAAGPSAIIAHVRDLLGPAPTRHLGHNPLGGIAVFLLLITLAVITVTGLFAGDEHNAGPFAGAGAHELSEIHEAAFRVLQGLVVIHILGVVVETFKSKDALVPAMITGRKMRRESEPGDNARAAGLTALLVAVGAGLAVSLALMAQPPANLDRFPQEHEQDDN